MAVSLPECVRLLNKKIHVGSYSKYYRKIVWITVVQRLIKTFLTLSPAKRQSLAQIPKFNFEMTLALGSILWCLKCIDIWLTPIWTPLWGPGGPKVPKTEKFRALLWNHFRWKSLQTLCQFTSHFWNFVEFPYYWENWEYFSNFDFSNFKL